MKEVLSLIIGISAIVAIPVQSMIMGMEAGRPYFKELFSFKSVLIKYIITMFVIVPYLAVIFKFLFPDQNGLWIGVLIISLTPASPGLLKSIKKLGGDSNISLAWFIVTIILSLIFIPINLLILENILEIEIKLGLSDVFIKMVILFFAPLLTGFFVSNHLMKFKSLLTKILLPIAKTAMLFLIIGLLVVAIPKINQSDIIELVFLLLFMICALTAAHFMGASEKNWGPILPFSIVTRLPAPAIILTQVNDTTDQFMGVILAYTILGVILMTIYSKLLYKKTAKNS